MPSQHYAIGNKAATTAIRYATGKYRNVSRGIIAMQKCIEVLEKANKEKAATIGSLQRGLLK